MKTAKSGPSLLIEGLTLSLGENSILKDITFEASPGTIHCVIGPNGGGKASLIRSLLGQMPHQGKIRIQWNSTSQTTGYVPQALDFDRTLPMTVGDFMAMICQQRPIFLGSSQKQCAFILSALERVGMQDKQNYQFGGLSGGERQRVLLAQALIPEPDLLILDEPASGLDKSGSEIMRSIIKELKS